MRPDESPTTLTNWAGNITFRPAELRHPTTVDEVRTAITTASTVRVLGTGHSFSPIADTSGTLISLARMPEVIEVDSARRLVRVSAATRWGDLARVVAKHNLGLHTMGSLPHISVAGSVATGTHGSGSRAGCLATAVRALTLVSADGSDMRIDVGDAHFEGSVVALGALGVVTELELELTDYYEVEQTVWLDIPLRTAIDQIDTILDSARSVSLFTTWATDMVEQVWVKRDVAEPDVSLAWCGGRPAETPCHPLPGIAAVACTTQLGQPGPWNERVPHFRADLTPSSGHELQTEFMVARTHARAALDALTSIASIIAPVVQISEIRSVASDSLWMSPFEGRESVCLHFTWVPSMTNVLPALAAVERVLEPYAARPHWGKVFTMTPATLRDLYPRLNDFTALRDHFDPRRVMSNAMLDAYLP